MESSGTAVQIEQLFFSNISTGVAGLLKATGSSCCFKGIRCDQADPYNIFVMQSERPDGRLKLMYAPITQSLVLGG